MIVVNFTDARQTIAAEDGELLLGSPSVAGGRMTLKPLEVAVWKR